MSITRRITQYMEQKPGKKVRIKVSVNKSLKDKLKRIADKEACSLSRLARMAIDAAIEEYDESDAVTYDTLRYRLRSHMDWFMREAMRHDYQRSFTMNDIREALRLTFGIKPKVSTMLTYNSEQMEKHGLVPLKSLDQGHYDLNKDYYDSLEAIIVQCGSPRRPLKYTNRKAQEHQTSKYHRYYLQYQRILRTPERTPLAYLLNESETVDIVTVQQYLGEHTSVSFGPRAVSTLLQRYHENGRGPPFIEPIGPGVYRVLHSGPNNSSSTEVPNDRLDLSDCGPV